MEQTAAHTGLARNERLDEALRFASHAHTGQRRKQDGRPFIEHPVAVAKLLARRGFNGHVLVAAYLHDVVEKTDTSLDEIERRFGSEVAAVVAALSEDGSIGSYGERKRALRDQAIEAGRDAALVFAADRLANIRDWHALDNEQRAAAAERLGTTFEERFEIWQEDLAELSGLDGELPFLAEVEIELRELGDA